MSDPGAAERVKLSIRRLKLSGGDRKTFYFRARALEGLLIIQEINGPMTMTQVIENLIEEKRQRLPPDRIRAALRVIDNKKPKIQLGCLDPDIMV